MRRPRALVRKVAAVPEDQRVVLRAVQPAELRAVQLVERRVVRPEEALRVVQPVPARQAQLEPVRQAQLEPRVLLEQRVPQARWQVRSPGSSALLALSVR